MCRVGFPLRTSFFVPVYFLEHACGATAVNEAMLMENFTACDVGFYVCAKKTETESEEKMAERK